MTEKISQISSSTSTGTTDTLGMTPWPEDLLNSPEQLIKDIKDSQAIIKAHTDLIAMRKKDLDDHLANGTIEKEFSYGDISAKLVDVEFT